MTYSSYGQVQKINLKNSFLTLTTNQYPSIKFTYKISNKSIDFLDTTVYIKNRRIHTSIFKKPTDTQNYLHYKPEHPRTLKNSIPFGQILRIKRICSEAREFLQNCKKMLDKFSERGYPKITIQEAFSKSTAFQRENLPKNKKKKNQREYPLLLPTIDLFWHAVDVRTSETSSGATSFQTIK